VLKLFPTSTRLDTANLWAHMAWFVVSFSYWPGRRRW